MMQAPSKMVRAAAEALERRLFRPVRDRMGTEVDATSGDRVRRYAFYEDYVRHQSRKLSRNWADICAHDVEYENIIATRYGALPLAGRSVLCVGARLGGEVRGFTRLGALAIGVDFEPGARNRFVVAGDAHCLQFADSVFDYVFTNIVDHILRLEQFVDEVTRVLKPEGEFICELQEGMGMGRYEARDLRDGSAEKFLATRLQKIGHRAIDTTTSYVHWTGKSIRFGVAGPAR